MSPAPFTRRALVRAAGVALGAAALPAGITTALAAETAPTGLPGAAPPAFDPDAYVEDLRAIGCRPYAFRAVRSGGILGPWRYGIAAPEGGGFGVAFSEAMARWHDIIDATPDHVERVGSCIASGGRL